MFNTGSSQGPLDGAPSSCYTQAIHWPIEHNRGKTREEIAAAVDRAFQAFRSVTIAGLYRATRSIHHCNCHRVGGRCDTCVPFVRFIVMGQENALSFSSDTTLSFAVRRIISQAGHVQGLRYEARDSNGYILDQDLTFAELGVGHLAVIYVQPPVGFGG